MMKIPKIVNSDKEFKKKMREKTQIFKDLEDYEDNEYSHVMDDAWEKIFTEDVVKTLTSTPKIIQMAQEDFETRRYNKKVMKKNKMKKALNKLPFVNMKMSPLKEERKYKIKVVDTIPNCYEIKDEEK